MRLSTPVRAIATGCLLFWAGLAHARTTFAEAEGGKIAYETCGAGDRTIVLLHDGILHAAAYDDVWPLLCQRFKVVRYDRRGYGATPAATAPFASVDDLAAVMKAAGVTRATLVGSSAGSGIAVDFALAHPEAVDGLVLAGPWVSGFSPSAGFIARSLKLVALIKLGDLEGAVKDPYILSPTADAERARVVALLKANPQNLSGAGRKLERAGPDAKDHLGEIRAPTLVLVGALDIGDVKTQAKAVADAVPGAQLETVPALGHFMYLEKPKAFADRVAAFVDGHPQGAASAGL
ncbi:alpha/beta fold hydrolase [Caulobacter sp. RL271]|jgi:pimeloyl-ACP methyl ester carboxylesterase|uniref:Alpha/beta hydrolase n=1 Tax=Caulobacter segnis TaxID=88688 RepID=A0ABY4ZWB0_9CAUL|nr:alpha/beta hydrolase [Caulobacter segnis]USQ96760.1 alpha/beta hydrolase [Caulobacter segnis]